VRKDSKLSIRNTTKGKPPRLPFELLDTMRKHILGTAYELSVAYVSKEESRRLNKTLRQKDSPTNVLSFSLSKTSGELIMHLPLLKKQAPLFHLSEKKFFIYLLIHGMLHLKGHVHNATMDKEEARLCRKFEVT